MAASSCPCHLYEENTILPDDSDALVDINAASLERLVELGELAIKKGIPKCIAERMGMKYRLLKCWCQIYPVENLKGKNGWQVFGTIDLFTGDRYFPSENRKWIMKAKTVHVETRNIKVHWITCDQYELITRDDSKEDKEKKTRKRKRTPDTATKCCVCIDKDACCALVPCGHQCLCEECAQKMTQKPCPICREPTEHYMHIYPT